MTLYTTCIPSGINSKSRFGQIFVICEREYNFSNEVVNGWFSELDALMTDIVNETMIIGLVEPENVVILLWRYRIIVAALNGFGRHVHFHSASNWNAHRNV